MPSLCCQADSGKAEDAGNLDCLFLVDTMYAQIYQ
jgi:hypothetical protein